MYRDRGMGTRKREMDRDKDRNRDRVTRPSVQGQRDTNKREKNSLIPCNHLKYGQQIRQHCELHW